MVKRKSKPTKPKGKRHAPRRKTATKSRELPAIQAAAPKTGAPTKFNPAYIEQARKLAALGAIDREIAEFFEVEESTFHRWKLAHPALATSLKAGKDVADNRVERSLYQNAVGYRYQAHKPFVDKDGGEHVVEYTEFARPDTVAQIFHLKNRRPDEWRDRAQVTMMVATADQIEQAWQRAQSAQLPLYADGQTERQ